MKGEQLGNSQQYHSRRERRQAERDAQRGKPLDSGTLFTRRRLLSLAAAVVTGGGAIVLYELQSATPSVTQSEEIINTFTQSDGKEVNSQEASLWKNYSQEELGKISDEQLLRFTKMRMDTVAQSLSKSQIPEFQKAAGVYHQYSSKGELETEPELSLDVVEKDFFMMTQPEISENIVRERISFDAKDLKKIKSDFVLGMLLTHELTHVDDQMKILSDRPVSDSAQDRLQYLAGQLTLNTILHEQDAYAAEAKAYIQGRKMGVATDVPEDLVNMAALFIECKLNKDDPRWVAFVTQRVPLQYRPKQQPKG